MNRICFVGTMIAVSFNCTSFASKYRKRLMEMLLAWIQTFESLHIMEWLLGRRLCILSATGGWWSANHRHAWHWHCGAAVKHFEVLWPADSRSLVCDAFTHDYCANMETNLCSTVSLCTAEFLNPGMLTLLCISVNFRWCEAEEDVLTSSH